MSRTLTADRRNRLGGTLRPEILPDFIHGRGTNAGDEPFWRYPEVPVVSSGTRPLALVGEEFSYGVI